MPTYCFGNRDTGQRLEVIWTISEMESKCEGHTYKDDNGLLWERDFATEHGEINANCGNWPRKSDAAGVHPDQIGDARSEAKRFGVPTNFDTQTGQAIFTSRSHRAQYLKAKGYHDKDGGYSDG